MYKHKWFKTRDTHFSIMMFAMIFVGRPHPWKLDTQMLRRHELYSTALSALLFCLTAVQATADEWPTFRGADRTGVAPDTNLLEQWPADGPKLIWEATGAGRGYADVAISGGRLYTLGDALSTADDVDEYLTCFDLSDGKQLWRSKTGSPWNAGQADWQSSRSTPTVDGDRVYVISPDGKLFCCDTEGVGKWKVDLKAKYGGKKAEMWGYSESVLIDGDNLVCTPGGPANTMLALNKMTGEKVWSTPRENDRGAGHASIVISEVGSTRVYVQTTGSGAMGVRASDGELLWIYDIEKTTAVAPTPIVRDDLVFFAAGYGRGGALLRQVAHGDGVKVDEVYPLNPKLTNKHGGIVLVGDHLYGDSDDRGTPFCADLMTGEVKWKSRGSGRKSASFLAADGHLYIRYSNGVMSLVKADPESFEEVSHFKVPGSGDRPSWAHPVIVDGRLYLREGDSIFCYSIVDDGSVKVATAAAGAAAEMPTSEAAELFVNGNFSKGQDSWEVEGGDGETATVEVAKEGPNGESAIRIEILSTPEEPWQLQMYQGDLEIEQGKTYVLTFWMKSNDDGTVKVNCMQNHDPWEHSTEQEVYLSTSWKMNKFQFDGPWDDDNARITFADLGINDARVYWIANCSLIEKPAKK